MFTKKLGSERELSMCYRFYQLFPQAGGGDLFYLSPYTISFAFDTVKSHTSGKHPLVPLSESKLWAPWALGLM